eukprot:TRINITY_DN83180_c0_g1_i1.p1 TRINITY_DN83180_c0_g1~~TRINITY_DN83180_c0_g1_i1.p1  ORF type:complete len:190 (-),score=58.20 TRINITY_DN83180_c0_g1_i1:129-698(-)
MMRAWTLAALLALDTCSFGEAASRSSATQRRSLRLAAQDPAAGAYTLHQYIDGQFCSGRYVALELTLDTMSQIRLAERTPSVLCNKLEKNATAGDTSFVVHSCPGDDTTGCPANCDACGEDLVKHFTLNICKDGWMLVSGPAPEDCTTEHKQCASVNQVDIGLARWCDKWPTAATYVAKSADEINATRF